ncbi:ABC transporter permease [Paenibacillus baekrokdamisoli]|uniref:ABC transporter permease n=1 Tax=Paenibacillus baekrokdamisoli TaxID=1712516 RepID=A0A3G9IX01_9BACL|nr:ABC transporter ATP-binding protein [Paenibacillus baekrokdamisoli]MBB3068603.1 ATP-binding cassette subfamily B protein/subfamily B ATP-binding cassette protein MsbA [Paenibacillus baekrokdamisoli]BBH23437.1 ABC transporter permease [Paenibacillus baekrokdamisoli]
MKNIRWIWGYYKKYKFSFWLGCSMLLTYSCFGVLMTWIQKRIIDDVFMEGHYELLVRYLIIFVLSYVLFNLLYLYGFKFLQSCNYRIHGAIVSDVMKRLYKLPAKNIHNERTAKYVNYVTGDVAEIIRFLNHQLPEGLSNFMSVIAISIVIGITSPAILLLVIILAAFYLVLGKYIGKRINTSTHETKKHKSELLVHMEEAISSTREVIAFHRGEWEMRKMDGAFQNYYSSLLNDWKVLNKKLILSEPVHRFAALGVLGYGGYQVIQGDLSIGAFFIAFQLAGQLMGSIHGLFNFVVDDQKNFSVHVERLNEAVLLTRFEDGQAQIKGPVTSIKFQDVHFRYSDDAPLVLNGLSLQMETGQKLAFVGSSGGGKSTITQLLLRYYSLSQGELLINGVQINQLAFDSWMERCAVVFQEPYLFPDTIRNNILLGRNISDDMLYETCKVVKIDGLIKSLQDGYETQLGERGINLSGGERQRIALARALVGNPEILILDEATSALDTALEKEIQQKIDEIRSRQTTVIIAHRLSTVQNADTIFVIDRGKVAAQGRHSELLERSERYRELVYAQRENMELQNI